MKNLIAIITGEARRKDEAASAKVRAGSAKSLTNSRSELMARKAVKNFW